MTLLKTRAAWQPTTPHLRRGLVVYATLLVALAVATTVAVSVGEFPVPIADVARSLIGLPSPADLIVQELRLPRVVTGLLAGAAFGMAGALFQSVIRNPLASPDLIGVTAGASAGAVLAITVSGVGASVTPGLALAGGTAAAVLVYVLAYRRGIQLHRLVVVGIALGGTGFAAGALNSMTSLLLIEADVTSAQQATVWLTGSLNGRTYEQARYPMVALLIVMPLLPMAARTVRSLALGDEVAVGLGLRIGRARLALLAAGVLLAAAATAAAGPIGFVALGAPQIARRLLRTSIEPLVGSALVGALVVTIADTFARQLFAPIELPVGVLTAAVGGPYLLWLLSRSKGL